MTNLLDYLSTPLLPAHGPSEGVERLWEQAHAKSSIISIPGSTPADPGRAAGDAAEPAD